MSTSDETRAVILAFHDAFNTHDVDAIMALMTDDVVFDDATGPDGEAYIGTEAVRGYWARFFASSPGAWFEPEDMFVADDRCGFAWRFTFDKSKPDGGHVRGVDFFRVRDGKVAEKFSYIKG